MSAEGKDPYFGLKYIAYLRTGLPLNREDLDGTVLTNFAKWQICKSRNILWNDPIWEVYTPQEIMVEYFAIQFDDDAELRRKFEASLTAPKQKDIDWFEVMEQKLKAEMTKDDKIKEGGVVRIEEEFEDKYDCL